MPRKGKLYEALQLIGKEKGQRDLDPVGKKVGSHALQKCRAQGLRCNIARLRKGHPDHTAAIAAEHSEDRRNEA